MTDDTTDNTELDFLELDTAREVMLRDAYNDLGQAFVQGELQKALDDYITHLYDNREDIKQAMEEQAVEE